MGNVIKGVKSIKTMFIKLCIYWLEQKSEKSILNITLMKNYDTIWMELKNWMNESEYMNERDWIVSTCTPRAVMSSERITGDENIFSIIATFFS